MAACAREANRSNDWVSDPVACPVLGCVFAPAAYPHIASTLTVSTRHLTNWPRPFMIRKNLEISLSMS
jgi:hypothetical protein